MSNKENRTLCVGFVKQYLFEDYRNMDGSFHSSPILTWKELLDANAHNIERVEVCDGGDCSTWDRQHGDMMLYQIHCVDEAVAESLWSDIMDWNEEQVEDCLGYPLSHMVSSIDDYSI